jgi:hypothetical protein
MSDQPNFHLTDEELNAYLDSELEPSAFEAVQKHLLKCDDCAARMEAVGGLFAQIESIPEISYQGDLADPVLTALQGTDASKARFPWWTALQLGLAGLLLVLIAPLSRLGPEGWRWLAQIITMPANWLLSEVYVLMVSISNTLYAIPLGVGRLLDVDGFGVMTVTNNLMIAAAILVAILLWVTGNTLLLGRNGSHS